MPGASLVRFVALAAFIVSIALGLWLLDAGRGWIVVGIVAAWLLASFVEWIARSRVETPWRLADAHGRRPGYPRAMPPPASAQPARRAGADEGARIPPLRRSRDPARKAAGEGTHAAARRAPPIESATPTAAAERIVTPEVSVARPRPGPDPRRTPEPDPEGGPERPVDDRPRPEPEPAPVNPLPDPVAVEKERSVVRFDDRQTGASRRWNLRELERAARDRTDVSAHETEARSLLLLHLRQFAEPDGLLPAEFEGVVRESFAALVGEREQA